MSDLNGKSRLAHVIQRARIIHGVDHVIVSTTSSISDDPIKTESGNLGVEVFSCSREDLLDRMYQPAKVHNNEVNSRLPLVGSEA